MTLRQLLAMRRLRDLSCSSARTLAARKGLVKPNAEIITSSIVCRRHSRSRLSKEEKDGRRFRPTVMRRLRDVQHHRRVWHSVRAHCPPRTLPLGLAVNPVRHRHLQAQHGGVRQPVRLRSTSSHYTWFLTRHQTVLRHLNLTSPRPRPRRPAGVL